jgi:hypothetical protein
MLLFEQPVTNAPPGRPWFCLPIGLQELVQDRIVFSRLVAAL